MLKRLARRIGYALFLLVTVFGLLEACFRFGCIPNAAHDQVRRAREEARHPHRVLLLGDSFSVEDPQFKRNMSDQLRAWLAARDVGLVNLAIAGIGPPDELDALRLFNADAGYHPDVVMVNYYVGNDLSDTLYRVFLGAEPRVGLLRYRGGRLMQRSFLLRWFFGVLREREIKRRAEDIRRTQMQSLLPFVFAAPKPAAQQAANPFLVDVAHGHPTFLLDNILIESDDAQKAWREVEKTLHEIAEWTRGQNARLVINIFPDTLQVNDSHYRFYEDLEFSVDKRLLTSTAPQDRLKAFCQKEGAVCNDLLPAFKAAPTECYTGNDDHWSLAGHTLAAQVIEQRLVEGGIVAP